MRCFPSVHLSVQQDRKIERLSRAQAMLQKICERLVIVLVGSNNGFTDIVDRFEHACVPRMWRHHIGSQVCESAHRR